MNYRISFGVWGLLTRSGPADAAGKYDGIIWHAWKRGPK